MKSSTSTPDPQFTISVLTENQTNALLRVTACLARHRVRVESLTCTEAPGSDTYQHTIVVRAAAERIRRAMKQIGSAVGVLTTDCRRYGETIEREVGLFKVAVDTASAGDALKNVLRAGRGRVLVVGADYIVIEKTGSREEIEAMFERLEPFGVVEFVRSGRAAVTKAQAGSVRRAETMKPGAAAADAGRR